jgi:hypothetical protein
MGVYVKTQPLNHGDPVDTEKRNAGTFSLLLFSVLSFFSVVSVFQRFGPYPLYP